jgi:hypothetical protein
MQHFWNGFEKQAAAKPGSVLNYAEMRAAELLKKRAKSGGSINYGSMTAKMPPKPLPKAVPAAPKDLTPNQILQQRRESVAKGGTPHTTWQDALKKTD